MLSTFITVTAALVVLEGCDQRREIPFDRNLWMKGEVDGGDREWMIQDLIQRVGIKTSTRLKVHALLGSPESVSGTRPDEDWYLVRQTWKGIEPSNPHYLVFRYSPYGQAVVYCSLVRYRNGQDDESMPL